MRLWESVVHRENSSEPLISAPETTQPPDTIDCIAAPRRSWLIKDELGRWRLCLVGKYGPILVIQIQLRRDGHEFHVRFPESIERTHVPPVSLFLRLRVAKRVGVNR